MTLYFIENYTVQYILHVLLCTYASHELERRNCVLTMFYSI